jgi:NTP pyrophosphatase (non-canonical NTP hydrolase)
MCESARQGPPGAGLASLRHQATNPGAQLLVDDTSRVAYSIEQMFDRQQLDGSVGRQDGGVVDLRIAAKMAAEVRLAYEQMNAERGAPPWDAVDFMTGFMGDVGDLAKLVMAHQGLRKIPDYRAKLRHELADCMWSLFVVAELVDVDLAETYPDEMRVLLDRVDAQVRAQRVEDGVAVVRDVPDPLG